MVTVVLLVGGRWAAVATLTRGVESGGADAAAPTVSEAEENMPPAPNRRDQEGR